MPLAFSYLRFSDPRQAAGDSVRRQDDRAADWCKRNKAQLDNSITLRDHGVSAFRGRHRDNPDLHALAGFIEAVQSGRVPRGSFLIVESLDRLTREHIRPALTLLLNLIEAGVRIVQLLPVEMVYDENVEPMTLMMAIMELNRGHSESKVKSERVAEAWAARRAQAPNGYVGGRVPAWVRARDGSLSLDPGAAATVRRVYAMARDGVPVHQIAGRLNAERTPVLGRVRIKGKSVGWSSNVVYHLLTTRAAIGEYQPHTGTRKTRDRRPAGDPIRDYYPAAIDPDTFHAVQAVIRRRAGVGRGRQGGHVNLFAGLLTGARDGGSLYYKHRAGRPAQIIPVDATNGTGGAWSCFPADAFEEGLLAKLKEIKVTDILPKGPAGRKVEAVSAKLEGVRTLKQVWVAKMDDPRVADDPGLADTITGKLAELSDREKAVAEELADAQRDAASPFAEAWGQVRTLADLVKHDRSEKTRRRLRSALRRSIESVHCIFAGSRTVRLAVVQVRFRGTDKARSYVIRFEKSPANRAEYPEGRCEAETTNAVTRLDLRDRDDVAAGLKWLDSIDLSLTP